MLYHFTAWVNDSSKTLASKIFTRECVSGEAISAPEDVCEVSENQQVSAHPLFVQLVQQLVRGVVGSIWELVHQLWNAAKVPILHWYVRYIHSWKCIWYSCFQPVVTLREGIDSTEWLWWPTTAARRNLLFPFLALIWSSCSAVTLNQRKTH